MTTNRKPDDIPAFSLSRLAKFVDEHKFPEQDKYTLYIVPTIVSGMMEWNGKVTLLYTNDGRQYSVNTTAEQVERELNRALEVTIEDAKVIKGEILKTIAGVIHDHVEGDSVVEIYKPPTDRVPKKGDLN